MPRLDVVCAVVGAATAFIVAEAATSPYGIRASRAALVVGLVMGGLAGWAMRAWLKSEPPFASRDRRWLPVLGTWLVAGVVTSLVVNVAAHMQKYGRVDSYTWEGFGIGVVGTVLSLPACAWLIARARDAKRARHGSLVAARDARAIQGALVACISLETIALAPNWRREDLGVLTPPVVFLVAAGALFAAGATLLWLDLRAAQRVTQLMTDVDELDELDHEREAAALQTAPLTDIGLGPELYVRDDPGEHYRAGRRRVPLLRGAPELAIAILRRSVQISGLRLALVALPLGVHLYASTLPPTP